MRVNKMVKMAAVTGMVAVMVSGCSLMKTESTQQIDPPQSGTDQSVTATGEVHIDMTADQAVNTARMMVFAKDAKGFVTPVSIPMPKTQSVAKTSLDYMVQGGPGDALLPQGFVSLLPKGTKLSVNLLADKKEAVVNFSKEFLNYNADDERKILEGIVYTLTGFSSINHVIVSVNGTQLTEMPKGHLPLDEPLSRSMGINLEKEANVEFGKTTPITLYFLNGTDEDYKYYVPVTRLVKRTDDMTNAVLEGLIKGPDAKKGLLPVIAPETKLLHVTPGDGLVTVDFSEQINGSDEAVTAEALQSVLLSLTETTGIPKVQFMVGGKTAQAIGADKLNYSKPVTRPGQINPYTM
jgi:germination protein M